MLNAIQIDALVSQWRASGDARAEQLVRAVLTHPDVLELEAALEGVLRYEGGPGWRAARDRARSVLKRAAIAKATGAT